jgi:uncharacterized protein (TIGR00251 family)
MLDLRQSGTDVFLPVNVQPRASRNAVSGLHGRALKLSVTAPPVGGAANEACLYLLATLLGVSRTRLSIARGEKGRLKLIRITQLSPTALRTQLHSLLPGLNL